MDRDFLKMRKLRDTKVKDNWQKYKSYIDKI